MATHKSIPSNVESELIQDAMAIIRFNESMGNKEKTIFFLERWLVKCLPPFETNADITKLHRLFTRIGFFIEDYMTKATSASPTEAYLSLPRMKFTNTLNRRVTLDDLTWPEKHRLFRAFFKFEVLMKIYDPRLKQSMDENYYRENAYDLLQELDPWIHESVLCVFGYVEACYGVIFAQLKKTHEAAVGIAETARRKPCLFPDNLYFSSDAHFTDIYLPRDCFSISWWLSCHGLDLLVHVLTQMRQTPESRERLRSWIYSISFEVRAPFTRLYDIERRKLFVHRPVCLSQVFAHTDNSLAYHLRQIDGTLEEDDASDSSSASSDSIYVFYPSRMPEEDLQAPIQFQIYRQRAWIFCDNWRLYRTPLFEHFPSPESIEIQQEAVESCYPITSLRERQRRRSPEWHDYWAGRTLEPPPERARNHFWEVEFEKNDICDISHFYDCVTDEGLSTFWRYRKRYLSSYWNRSY
ncbi:hypothetical protein FPOA_10640 [Fusarium poae]|uniref:Uncharacterized protein n=1 Tax=Fusarium poae TaxID=36050 RepID=A0A1B8AEK1_FUSPO|nr:hypothetical protein FPOA_10640 [Fusarium poae]